MQHLKGSIVERTGLINNMSHQHPIGQMGNLWTNLCWATRILDKLEGHKNSTTTIRDGFFTNSFNIMSARAYHPSVSDPSNMMGEPFAPGVQIPNVFYAISNVK
jgi:hypothetical protein